MILEMKNRVDFIKISSREKSIKLLQKWTKYSIDVPLLSKDYTSTYLIRLHQLKKQINTFKELKKNEMFPNSKI